MCGTLWLLLLLTASCFVACQSQQKCRLDEHQCGSGECINEDLICDGTENCTDGSDESLCLNFPCPSYTFRCAYGACINMQNFCDGKKDCKDNSDEINPKCSNGTAPLVESKCSRFQFACADGSCIDDFDLCDGKANCPDATDESVQACSSLTCLKYTFKCDYGACINSKLRCDGTQHCYDGSDEKGCPGRPDPVTQAPPPDVIVASDSCTLPNLPLNGQWQVFGTTRSYSPGEVVTKGTILQYSCATDYTLSPNNAFVYCDRTWDQSLPTCASASQPKQPDPVPPREVTGGGCVLPAHPENGKWRIVNNQGQGSTPGLAVTNGTVLQYECNTQHVLHPNNDLVICKGGWPAQPQCLKTCSPIANTKRMTARCTLNGLPIDCRTPYDGTQATLECSPLYEDNKLAEEPFRNCNDGSWDIALPKCEPICGLKNADAKLLVVGGKNAERGDYPWMVGIYTTSDLGLICGGSIITPEITLTAAHCFRDSMDPNYYRLAAGKYYREYNETRDKNALFSNIKSINVHSLWENGANMFAYDIAVLVVAKPFKISPFVMPVCIDYRTTFDESSLWEKEGAVAGWGHTVSGDHLAPVLKELKVTYRSRSTCALPADFSKFLNQAPDKMCASAIKLGESSCSGDSGGPLMFPDAKHRYYVRGIVSIAVLLPETNGCDPNHPTLFTAVHHHAAFINQHVARNRVSDD